MVHRLTNLLNEYNINYTNNASYNYRFTYRDRRYIIFHENDEYTMKIDEAYFVINEPIDVIIEMLTKLFSGMDIQATSKAMAIRSIIFRYNQMF